MNKTKTRQKRTTKTQLRLGRIIATQKDMTYKDIKRHVVARGMPFDEVINSNVHTLSKWLNENIHNQIDADLLDAFDDWQESQIKDPNLIAPSLRLGYVSEPHNEDEGEEDEDKPKVKKRPKGFAKKKKKREKTSAGIFKGTKKALTFKLAQRGRSREYTIRKVMKKFPDAKEKSINIWYKKALKSK